MKYENLQFIDIEINTDSVDFNIEATDELIEITDNIRKEKGFRDSALEDNDVYYNFYLVCNPEKKELKIIAVCNHGERDDYEDYELPISDDEKFSLTFQVIKELLKEELI